MWSPRQVPLAIAAAIALMGCGSQGTPSGKADKAAASLTFAFRSIGPSGYIDQTLEVSNNATKGVRPTLKIVPLDAAGQRVPGITVQTAFGTDRGKVAVPARASVLDIVRFVGRRRYEVEDVRVSVRQATPADIAPQTEPVEVTRLAADGREVAADEPVQALRVDNPNSGPVVVRVVLVTYDLPPDGEPQHYESAISLPGRLQVAAEATRRVVLPTRLKGRAFGSVKAVPAE